MTLIEKFLQILRKFYLKNFLVSTFESIKSCRRYPGINPTELIFKLKITKQSLNRVLRELVKMRLVKEIKMRMIQEKKILCLLKMDKVF